MQLRSANFATAGVASKCNPIIIALDLNNDELYRAPLNQIDDMSPACRRDYEQGFRGIRINFGSSFVRAWTTPSGANTSSKP
jgi:hypothetical protein